MPRNETVLITGAGSGIGREFARLFAADGATVVAASLLEAELAALKVELASAGAGCTPIVIDLSQPDAAERLLAACDAQALQIDTLINNAGFADFADVVDADLGKIAAMVALNVTTLTKLSALFGGRMKARGRGAILNVGSTAGMIPSPRMAAYCGTKSYVNTFTYALAVELAPFGVSVCCLTPGATATKFADASGISSFGGKSMLKSMFSKGQAGSPRAVAEAGYAGLRARKRHVLTGTGALGAGIVSRALAQHRIPQLLKNV